MEQDNPRKRLYKTIVGGSDQELANGVKKYSFKKFDELLSTNPEFQKDLFLDLQDRGMATDETEFANMYLQVPTKAQPAPQPSQPPAVSLAPPQRQSIEQQAARQATGFVPPMAVQPEQPVFQPFVQFKNEAELQQTAKSPVFKDYSAASAVIADREKQYEDSDVKYLEGEDRMGPTGKFNIIQKFEGDNQGGTIAQFDTEGQMLANTDRRSAAPSGLIMPFKDAETDFAKMSPEQQAQIIAGSTGSELAESKKPKPTLLQQGKQAISDIASSFNRSVFKAPSAIAKTVSELGTGAYNLMGGDAKVEQDYLYQIADKYDKWIDDSEFAKQFIGDKNVNSLAGDVGSGLGQIATMITAGGGSVAQGLKSAPSLLRGVAEKFLTPASGVAFSQVFSSEYDNMKAKGESDNTALKQALANAFVSAPLESIPLINLTERMNAINPSLARKVINTLAQGFDEMTQERLQQAFSNVTNNQLAQLESSIVKWSEGLDRSGEAGGLTGLIVGAIGQARIKRTKTPEVSGPSGQPPTQLGGIPTIPAPPNAPEFVPPVPPPSGADQTTYETVTPEELQAFQQGQIDPERAAAIADDVALIQSGQKDINSIEDPNYRVMVESAMGAGQQQQQQGTAQNISLENKVKETESKIKNKGLFLAEVDENGNRVVDKETGRQSQSVGEIISQSDDAPVPTSVREINGIEFVEFSNPRTGDVDVIVTGKNDGSYVGYYRLYDNGKPTNQWSSKFENPSRNKEDFKTMISGVQSMLPEGHEYTEKTSISTDGLRVWNQQLNKGYELQTDENGNIITNKVAINGDAIVNELGIDVDKGSFENISVRNNTDIKKVRQALLPYLQKLGLNESNLHFQNGTVYIDLPVLKKSTNQAAATSQQTGESAPLPAAEGATTQQGANPAAAELPKPVKGRKQIEKTLSDLTETQDPLSRLNLIHNFNRTVGLAPDAATEKEISEIQKEKERLEAEGYEVVDLTGKKFNPGYRVFVEQSIPDENLEEGQEIISRVMAPQINKDGKMVQPARVVVTVGTKPKQQSNATPAAAAPVTEATAETGGATTDVGTEPVVAESGRPVVEVEADQVVEEEKPLTKEEAQKADYTKRINRKLDNASGEKNPVKKALILYDALTSAKKVDTGQKAAVQELIDQHLKESGLKIEEVPIGTKYNETNTSLDATIAGEGIENLKVIEVLSPIIRDANNIIVSMGKVIVMSEAEIPAAKQSPAQQIAAKEQAEGKAEAPKAGSVVGGEVKPIRQLGTGANVYFETDGYRVNDGKDGKTYLIIRDENDKTGFPLNTIEFDNATEAVFVANKISEIRPDGLTNEYNIDKIVDSFKEEYKQSLKETPKAPKAEAPKPKGKATIIIEEKPKEPLIPKQKLEKIKEKVKSDPNVLLRTGKIEGKNTGFFAIPEQGGPFVDDSFNDLGVNEETSAYTMPNDFKIKDLSNMVFDDYKKNKEDEKARAEGYDGVKIMEMDGTTVMDVVNPKKLIKLDESLPELRNEKLQEASSKTRKAEGGQSAKQSSEPTEKKPRKRGRSINVQAAMNVQLPNNKEAAVMQTILENPLSEDILQSIFGGPDTQAKSGRKSIKGERSARISMLKKNGVKSVGKMAELAASKLAEWDGNPDAMPNDFSDGLEDLVIDTILNYNSKESIAKDLLAMANLEQQQFDEQWYAGQQNEDLVRESEGIVDALTDEEFVELLGLNDEGVAEFLDNWNEERAESEKSPEQKEAEKIVSEAKQKVSDAEKALKQANNAAGQSLNIPLGEKTPLGLTVQRGNADAQRKVKEAETALELAKSDLAKAESQLDKLKGKKTSQLEIDTKANPLTPFQTKGEEGVISDEKPENYDTEGWPYLTGSDQSWKISEYKIEDKTPIEKIQWARWQRSRIQDSLGITREEDTKNRGVQWANKNATKLKNQKVQGLLAQRKTLDEYIEKQLPSGYDTDIQGRPSYTKSEIDKLITRGILPEYAAKKLLPSKVANESILDPFRTKNKEGQDARAKLKEKVGPVEYKRLENIAKNGEKILRSLDGKIIKIDCP